MDLFKEHGMSLQELLNRIAVAWDTEKVPEELLVQVLETVETIANEANYVK